MVDDWSFELDNVTTDEPQFCSVCQFCLHEDKRDFVCHNEDSENYGKNLDYSKIKKWACRDFTGHIYANMSLKEALRINTLHDDHAGTYYSYKLSDNKSHFAIVSFAFKSNKALADFMDANMRLFTEYVKLAKADGDFRDETED